MSIEVKPNIGEEVCDFCNSSSIRYIYKCKDFYIDPQTPLAPFLDMILGSKGDWAACKICSNLIDSKDKNALAKRSIETYAEKSPQLEIKSEEEKEMVSNFIKELHELFWKNKMGNPIPITTN